MTAILKAYRKIIKSYEIRRYRQYGGAYEFVATIYFKDGSELHIRDYLFLNGERKYAFHWQDQNHQLKRRWDNSRHHKHLASFPYHVHTPKGIDVSSPITLKKVLEFISTQLSKN
jgi:hypothetical protein